MFDRLPTPFGLVRFGVAPDHLKIKNVTRTFEKIAQHPRFRFFGNVDIGKHVSVDELRDHYHLMCFATGAQTDRKMGIPGEDLEGSHPATDFVAWYNGHPDYRDFKFDLTAKRVAVVGIGNVAVDVARILCLTPEELKKSDIAEHALEALSNSNVKEVMMLGRRGPAQAAYTNPEIQELGELQGAAVQTIPAEVELDPLSQEFLDQSGDKKLARKVEITQSIASTADTSREKRLVIRFLVSPTDLLGNEKVEAIRIVKNRLEASGDRLKAVATSEFEEHNVGLVFRSVGYRGVAVPGLPLDEQSGVINNLEGRVIDPDSGTAIKGAYVSGWIKRGPSGVIGTNKPDGYATARVMLEDARAGKHLEPKNDSPEVIDDLVRTRQPAVVSYSDWRRLDAIELASGEAAGRPRIKVVSRDDVAAALEQTGESIEPPEDFEFSI